MKPVLLAILGPTAAGKSDLAINLAERLDGEIISCDSMMVYRGLDIGAAKPSPAELARVPHHLIDVIDISERYDVKAFIGDARQAIDAISGRRCLPILCGGTGMYAKALLYGYTLMPHDDSIKADIRREFAEGGAEAFLQELAAVDAETAARVAANPRHLMRAVEVVRTTGKPLRDFEFANQEPPVNATEWILFPAPDLARRRIEDRTDEMLSCGWIAETRELLERGLLQAPTAMQALGYATIIDFIHGRISSSTELRDRIVTRTCRFAKRQRTWFRHQHPNARFLEIDPTWTTNDVADQILRTLNAEVGIPG